MDDKNTMKTLESNLFIVILRYNVPLEKIDAFRSAHLDFLNNYYSKDIFITSGPQVPRNGGIIVAKSANKQTLQKILANDPFAINNLASYEVIEFTPSKWSSKFEKFLSEER